MRENIKSYTGEYVGANVGYDVGYGYKDGFEWHEDAKFRDVQIADPLLNELEFSYSLKNIGERYGIKSKEETILHEAARSMGLDPKQGLWRLHSKYVGTYATQDVSSPLDILRIQEKLIDERGLRQIWDLETAVLPVLIRMKKRGVRIDFDRLDNIELWAEKKEREALDFIKRETGIEIPLGEVWKPDYLAPALEYIGLKLGRTQTGKPHIDKEVLESANHPVPEAIRLARKVNKIRTTFATSIRRYAVNGRIHCSYHQIIGQDDEKGNTRGVRYGRLAASDPNMQQQPSKDRDPETAGEWRKIFVPDEGAMWACNDYSQQEPRWTTYFAAQMDLPKAREAARRYRENPETDNHDMMTRLVHGDKQVDAWEYPKYKVERGYCKNIFLGLCYGEGGPKLCRDIDKPTRWGLHYYDARQGGMTIQFCDSQSEAMELRMDAGKGYVREFAGIEGQGIIDRFDSEVPYVGKLAKTASNRANEKGYVKTILGRRLHFHRRQDGSYDYTHKALNRIIQGSSADQTKKAIVEIDRAGYFLQLQVHDETNSSTADETEAKAIGEIMSNCLDGIIDTLVPFKVDTEVGPSWGEVS
jgi:DNA polymerase I-like protein with 3'-5' exonuclease and polymerase domains